MKKRLCIGILLIIVALCGCSQTNSGPQSSDSSLQESYEASVSFTATILENNQNYLLVEPDENTNERRSSDKITVTVKDVELLDTTGSKITVDSIKAGNQVEITHSGEILETYPAQIYKCYRIKLLG